MKKIAFGWLLLVSLFAITVFAEDVKIIKITKAFTSSVAGTPRVVYDHRQHAWVVVWRKGSAIQRRFVNEDGTMSSVKSLATGVSSTEQSFDLALDTHVDDEAHLLAFENLAGLHVRALPFLNPGATHLIESGAHGSMPRLVFDPDAGVYFLFWLGSQDGTRSVLRGTTLSEDGETLAAAVNLASAPSGQTFGSLNVARKPDGSMTAILLQQGKTKGSVLKVNISVNGALQDSPRTFQKATLGLNTIGDIDFSDDGKGFGIWVDKKSLKRREVTASGGFGGVSESILNAVSVDAKLIQTGISFNPITGQFVGVWTNANETVLVNLNGTTGAPENSPSSIATSLLKFSRNPRVSANNPNNGKTLVVWEDSSIDAGTTGTAKFRIRGAIVTPAGSLAQAIPGSYDLSFFDHTMQPVTSLPVNQELVLHAYVKNSDGVAAERGAVKFQFCAGRGGRSLQTNPLPKLECESGGTGVWVSLITMKLNAGTCPGLGSGNACVNFGAVGTPRSIGFRFLYTSQGSGIANGASLATDFTWF